MKLHYYPETDSLYLEFKSGPGVETVEVVEVLNVDLAWERRGGGVRHRPCVPTAGPVHSGNHGVAASQHEGGLNAGG